MLSKKKLVLIKLLFPLVILNILLVACAQETPQNTRELTQSSNTPQSFNVQESINRDMVRSLSSNGNSIDNNVETGISVTGMGVVSIAPDIATIQIEVESTNVTVTEAKNKTNKAMIAVNNYLDNFVKDPKNIQTKEYSIYPSYQWNDKLRRQKLIGYKVRNVIVVTIENIDAIGEIIDRVVVAGGDLIRINSINFSTQNMNEHKELARKKAVNDILSKAQQLASYSGVQLGNLLYLREFDVNSGFQNQSGPVMRMAALEADSVSISPGELELIVKIEALFSIVQ